MTAIAAVTRYTLVELSRRRILLVFFIIGAVGIVVLGVALKIAANAIGASVVVGGPPGSTPPDPAQVQQVIELGFVNDLIGVLAFFALLVSFAIGMTAIYHDLDSGAAVSIFSKPISRLGYTAGKIAAAVVAMLVVVGALSLEARLVMQLFGGGLDRALWGEAAAQVGNAILLMLLVLALSAWMNNIVAAIIAFIYNGVASFVVTLHQQLDAGNLGNNQIISTVLNVAYWLVPHALRSDAQREITKKSIEIFSRPERRGGPSPDQIVAGIPGASSATDIIWWIFLVALFATLVYVAVRRRQI